MSEVKEKILIVDDNITDKEELKKILEDEYEILEADNDELVMQLLEDNLGSIALMIINLEMQGMDGSGLLELLKGRNRFANPVVMIITSQTEAEKEKCLEKGATDFLRKPFAPRLVKHRIESIVRWKKVSMAADALKYDSLTGLYTREYFYESIEKILKNHPDTEYDMICGDVENFSVINAQYGIEKGDELLCYIADFYRDKFGATILCSRIGADNFAIFCEHGVNYKQYLDSEITTYSRENAPVGNYVVKYGVYENVDRKLPPAFIYDRARLALHKSKHNYGVKIAKYDMEQSEELVRKKMILDNMEEALSTNQFQVYFQPKVGLATGRVEGAEALVRWIHPEYGFMPPDSFIPVFEENGFIWRLDYYVTECVCRKLDEWKKSGMPVVPISVNLSRRDFEQEHLVEDICRLTDKYGIEHQYIHLEVTESAYTENPEQVIFKVTGLRKAGFQIEMDDFGTGYSSLNMLSELPIDILKLDKRMSQKRNIQQNQTILNFVFGLAQCIGLITVAEGVENIEMVEKLRKLGCDMVQGYYYAKPLPVHDFEKYLADNFENTKEIDNEEKTLLGIEEIEYQNEARIRADLRQKTEIIKMIDNNISGGLKGSKDDADYSFRFVGEGLPKMFGYTYDEFMDMTKGTAKGMVYPPDEPAARKIVDDCFARGVQYSVKYRVPKKDGTLKWVLDSGQKYLDENGEYQVNSIITDIDDVQQLLEQLESKVRSEKMLVKCIETLAETENLQNALNNLLALIGEFYQGERAYIVEFYWDKKKMSNTYEWCGSGVTCEKNNLQNLDISIVKNWIEEFDEQGSFYLSSLQNDVDMTSSQYRILEQQNIESLIATPLKRGSQIVGFIGVDNPSDHIGHLDLLSSITPFIVRDIYEQRCYR